MGITLAWPIILPQVPQYAYVTNLKTGLTSPDEIINPIRNRTYPEHDANFTFYMTAAQFGYLLAFYEVTLNQCAIFTAPWLQTIGFESSLARIISAPKGTRLAEGKWMVTINIEIIKRLDEGGPG